MAKYPQEIAKLARWVNMSSQTSSIPPTDMDQIAAGAISLSPHSVSVLAADVATPNEHNDCVDAHNLPGMPSSAPNSPTSPCVSSPEASCSSGGGRTGRFSAEERRILVGLIWNDSQVLSAFCHQQRKQNIRGKSFMHLITDRFNEKTNQKRSHDAVRHHLKLRRSNLGPLVDKGLQIAPAERDIRLLDKLLEHRWVCSSHNACTRCLQMHRLRVQRGLARCDYASCGSCDQRLPSVKAPFDARSLLLEVRRRFYSKVAQNSAHHLGGAHSPYSQAHAPLNSPRHTYSGLSSSLHASDFGNFGIHEENDRVGVNLYNPAGSTPRASTRSGPHSIHSQFSSMFQTDSNGTEVSDYDRTNENYGEERPLPYSIQHSQPPPPPISTTHNILHLSQVYPDPLDLLAGGRTSSHGNNTTTSSNSNPYDFDYPTALGDLKSDDAGPHNAFQRSPSSSASGTSRALAQLLKLTPRDDDNDDDRGLDRRQEPQHEAQQHVYPLHVHTQPKSPSYMRLNLHNLNTRCRNFSETSTPSSRSSSPVSPNSRAQSSASSPMLSPTRQLPGGLAPLSLNGPPSTRSLDDGSNQPTDAGQSFFALSHPGDSPPSPMGHFVTDDFFASAAQHQQRSHLGIVHKRKANESVFSPGPDFDAADSDGHHAFEARPQAKSPRLA
ncbi:Hypothetical Protein FCC1311_018512 [Hondaea fermentalgiana]|uniref:Uncharacterized protein n=1 Tax=Hondaea fermentalgiana TaxID=2315210 RepID=A0A2R5G3P3_9STRA|nr:Hypothetical Protein FCC1311_018512 [Hondaea fermentalgiana]|eukprot:GBG25632.1 Hypothetical Protein FCC1311_018512 [Hondaea fermentalgiana]